MAWVTRLGHVLPAWCDLALDRGWLKLAWRELAWCCLARVLSRSGDDVAGLGQEWRLVGSNPVGGSTRREEGGSGREKRGRVEEKKKNKEKKEKGREREKGKFQV